MLEKKLQDQVVLQRENGVEPAHLSREIFPTKQHRTIRRRERVVRRRTWKHMDDRQEAGCAIGSGAGASRQWGRGT